MTIDQYESQSQVFKALMHPARLAILDILRGGEQCVCHLEATLGLRQAYISQQLSVLREAGLVEDRRDGWNIYYRVALPAVFGIVDAAMNLTGTPARLGAEPVRVEGCRCPKCLPEPVVC